MVLEVVNDVPCNAAASDEHEGLVHIRGGGVEAGSRTSSENNSFQQGNPSRLAVASLTFTMSFCAFFGELSKVFRDNRRLSA